MNTKSVAARAGLLLVALLFCFTLLQSAEAAPLPPEPTWMKWNVDVAFYYAPKATLRIDVGHYDQAGDPITTASTSEMLDCNVVGSVEVKKGYADFTGGHIPCLMPNLADMADALVIEVWGNNAKLTVTNNATQHAAYVKVDAQPWSDGANPLFHHPDVSLELPSDQQQTANLLTVAGQSDVSSYGTVTGMTVFKSVQDCDGNTGTCEMAHWQDGTFLSSNVFGLPNHSYHFAKTYVFIGMNPATGELFFGRINGISVDPGNYFDDFG